MLSVTKHEKVVIFSMVILQLYLELTMLHIKEKALKL